MGLLNVFKEDSLFYGLFLSKKPLSVRIDSGENVISYKHIDV